MVSSVAAPSAFTPSGQIVMPQMLTVEQVMQYLGISKTTAYSLLRCGKLPSYPIGPNGGAIRIALTDVMAYLESIKTGVPVESATPIRRPLILKHARPRRMGSRKKAPEPALVAE